MNNFFTSYLPSVSRRKLTPLLLFAACSAQAQTGVTIGAATAPDPSAALEIASSSKGALLPRLTEAARLAMGTGSVPAPAPGLIVYQTDGAQPGFWYASSPTSWVRLTDQATASGQYIQNQTATDQAGSFRIGGTGLVGYQLGVGLSNPTDVLHVRNGVSYNVATFESAQQGPHLSLVRPGGGQAVVSYIGQTYGGFRSGALELRGQNSVQLSGGGDPSNPTLTAHDNGRVGIGLGQVAAAYTLDVGGDVSSSGLYRLGGAPALYYRGSNAFVGTSAFAATAPTGFNNTVVGFWGGASLTTGYNNTTLGFLAGDALSTGNNNVAIGIQAGGSLDAGSDNVFIGHDTGLGSVSGSLNIGIGTFALSTVQGNENVALGSNSGNYVRTGGGNTFLGPYADLSSTSQHSRATAVGYNAKVDQDDALVLGDAANAATRVGIGTTTPGARLEVSGDLKVSSAGNSTGQLGATGSGSTTAGGTDMAQSFVLTTAATLTSIRLVPATTGTATLTILSGAGSGGPALSSPQTIALTPASTTYPLSTPLALGSGTYTILLNNIGAAKLTDGNGYAGGSLYLGNMNFPNSDLDFTVSYTIGPVTSLAATTAGQVGIGTDAPGATLDVAGASSTVRLQGLAGSGTRLVTAAADGTLGTQEAPDGTTFIQNQTSADQAGGFRVGGNSFVGGKLGVGIGSGALDRLHVENAGGQPVLLGGGANTGSELKLLNTGTGHMSLYNKNGTLTIARTSTLSQTNTLGSAVMTVGANSSGSIGSNVGIGTANPAQKLDVAGSLSPNAIGTEGLLRLTRPDNTGVKYANTAEWRLGTYAAVATTTNATSRLDLRMGNGATNTPDVDVLTVTGNGRLGIGTTAPATALDVVGDVQIPAANGYTYAAAKTYTLTLGAADFVAESPSNTVVSATNVGNSLYLAASTTGLSLRAPLRLPHGAIITGVTAFVTDNSTTADASCAVWGYTPETGSTLVVSSSVSTSGNSGTQQALSVPPLSTASATINNANAYYFRFQSTAASGGANLSLSGVRITFTVRQAD